MQSPARAFIYQQANALEKAPNRVNICTAGAGSFQITMRLKISATTGLVFFKRRPNSLYSKKPLNSAVQLRSRNSMNILRVSPCSEHERSGQQPAGQIWEYAESCA